MSADRYYGRCIVVDIVCTFDQHGNLRTKREQRCRKDAIMSRLLPGAIEPVRFCEEHETELLAER